MSVQPKPAATGSPNSAWSAWVNRLGVAGLYIFAFFAWLGQAGGYIGLGLMIAAAVLQWQALWRAVRLDPLLPVFIAFVAALGVSTTLALLERPDEAHSHLNAGLDLLKLWFFVIVAWWLRGDQRRLLRVLALALAGFVLGRLKTLDGALFEAILTGQRVGFGLAIIAFGQYSAAALLGLALLGPRLWQALRPRPAVWRWLGACGFLVLGFLLLQGVIIAQSRGVWLALSMVIAGLFLCTRYWTPSTVPQRDALARANLIMALLIGLVVMLNSPIIFQHLALGSGFFDHLLSGQYQQIDDRSVQARLVMYDFGIQRWHERPWLGWGPGAPPHLLQGSGDELIASFNDLHNIVIDLLVRLGVLGLLPLALGVGAVFLALRQAYREDGIERDVYLLLAGLIALHFLCALTNFRALNTDWRFYWLLVAGAAYSYRLARPRRLIARTGAKTSAENV